MTAAGAGAPIEVVCIIGYGRSGSTVLDTVLGSHPEVESVGELVNLPSRGWTNNEFCACGVRARDCAYWSAVWSRWAEATGEADPAPYLALQAAFERTRRIPRLLRVRRWPTPAFERYGSWSRALYASILEVSGKRVVVDSSKYAVRAFALACVPGLDVRLVQLVRDPRGVAWSLAKAYQRDDAAGVQHDIPAEPPWQTAWQWTQMNAVAAWVRGRVPSGHAALLRYEDFVRDPAAALARVGAVADLDFGEVGRRVATGTSLPVGHTIAGNRVRMQGAIRLRPDFEWRERLPARGRRAVEAIAAPLMLRFGYPIGLSEDPDAASAD